MNIRLLPPLLTVVASLAISAWFYPDLPDPVPTHWNGAGQPDSWSSRTVAVALLPAIQAGTLLLVWALSHLPSERQNLERSAGAMNAILLSTGLLLTGVHFLALNAAVSEDQTLSIRGIALLLGGLFVVIGNVMPTLRRNSIAGIRIPPTMESDRTWALTHRFAGWLFLMSGVAIAALGWVFDNSLLYLLPLTLLAPIASIIYAYRVHEPESNFAQ